MLPIIGIIASAIGSLGSSWLENRKVKAQGKIEITKAKQGFIAAKYTAKAAMDLKSLDGMQFSWKDEYLLIILTIPVIMCFIPFLATYVGAGFAVLNTCPEWYKWALTGIIAATFGLRTWAGIKK